jgi:hypothetical protein
MMEPEQIQSGPDAGEKLQKLVRLTASCRLAQSAYFKTKGRLEFHRAVTAEAELDKYLRELNAFPGRDTAPTLF